MDRVLQGSGATMSQTSSSLSESMSPVKSILDGILKAEAEG